jgi:hypothetical protein
MSPPFHFSGKCRPKQRREQNQCLSVGASLLIPTPVDITDSWQHIEPLLIVFPDKLVLGHDMAFSVAYRRKTVVVEKALATGSFP